MDKQKVMETLEKQLQLLSERSKQDDSYTALSELTDSMCKVVGSLYLLNP